MAPVLSGESHLLVDNDLAAEGVGTEANGDGNDNSCKTVSNHVLEPTIICVLSYPMEPTQVGSV